MSEVKIQAEPRTEFGKGAARRIRRADKIPAVLYGHGADPIHVTLPGHEMMLALKHSNALLTIAVDGKTQLTLPKQVQRDPIKGFIEHVDLIVVTKGEKVTVNVPIVLVGEPGPDALVVTEHSRISIEAEATHIPQTIEVSIEGAEVGTQIHARDLILPKGCTLEDDEDLMMINITNAPSLEALEAELAEAEAEASMESGESTEPAEGDEGSGEGAEDSTEGEEKSE